MDKELRRLLLKYNSTIEQSTSNENSVDVSKLDVQSYIDNTIWRLFSRTELQNKTLLFNNDQNRLNDKRCLERLISTLFECNKEVNNVKFLEQLHSWIVHIVTIYLSIATPTEKKKMMTYFIDTTDISNWAIPLIQYKIEKKSQVDDYIDTIHIIFGQQNVKWTEDDYLMVLDQLAIEYNYNKIIEFYDKEEVPEALFQTTQTIIDNLITTMKHNDQMTTLLKRIAQTITQVITLLVHMTRENEWDCQKQIDSILSQLICNFNDLKQWFLLPSMPFQVLSSDALWKVTTHLLQIKDNKQPSSLNEVINENLPNITRFQYELQANHVQGYFMLTCLTTIASSIHPGVDDVGFSNDTNHIISSCIITIISYTLFMAAFIDKDLREFFYKDARAHLSTICKQHTFIISLLFRWTIEYISVMERMSLYLFHALPLSDWTILKDDLKLIHKLLAMPGSQQTVRLQLVKYILAHLNYDYIADSVDRSISKSQPWHRRKAPFLSYELHEEIAYILLDAHLPSQEDKRKGPMELVGTVVAQQPIEEHWTWSIVVKLKLYDCPVSPRATDTDQSLDIPFLKRLLNQTDPMQASYDALLVYVSFMLSATSRHFLRFESNNGWLKLLAVLKRGSPEAVVHAFSDMVPSFVFMHGDDFFHDDSVVDFLKLLVEFKPDPLLTKTVNRDGWAGVAFIVGSHVWHTHLIDSTMEDDGFSYVDLMLHSWIYTVFRRTDWMWQGNYVCIMDTLCKLAFILDRHQLVQGMLQEQQKQIEAEKTQTVASSPRLARILKNLVVAEESFSTLLVGEWSLLKANMKLPKVETQYHWFTFYVLMMETKMEAPIRDEMAAHMTSDNPSKPLEYFAIYRWLQHILILPVDHVLLPLYCQMFFSLYYQRFDDHITMGGLFFATKKDMISKLRNYVASVQTFYGQKIGSGDTTCNAEVLQPFFYAVWLWLGNDELLNMIDIQTLSSHYDTKHLALCYGMTETPSTYWMDLVNLDGLKQEFNENSWEGSDRFRTSNVGSIDENSSRNSLYDQISLSTSMHRMKLVTDESTTIPLPSVVINTPTPVRSNSTKRQ